MANIFLAMIFLRNYEEVMRNEFNTRTKLVLLVVYLGGYIYLVNKYSENLVFWIY